MKKGNLFLEVQESKSKKKIFEEEYITLDLIARAYDPDLIIINTSKE